MPNRWFAILFVSILTLALVACGSSGSPQPAAEQSGAQAEQSAPAQGSGMSTANNETTHDEVGQDENGSMHDEAGMMHEEEEHMHAEEETHDGGEPIGDEHAASEQMAMHHNVPAEAAAVENPVAASDESVAAGRVLYSENCAICHGETGEGDGPGAAGLEPSPANLHEDHVQGNSDGALFWIISHGREGTAMPAWEGQLTAEQRWNVVNFLRTFQEQ